MLVACLIGAAVFAQLPAGKSPTLRQAIVAAGVPASAAPATNLDRSAIYVYSHPSDPKRMRVVEISVADAKQVTSAKLDDPITKQSLSTLFASH